MASKHQFSNRAFLTSVREYLPTNSLVRELDSAGRAGADAIPRGLKENTFYLFDAEAACAVGHAIADLALEEARGSFLVAIQDFNNLESYQECFEQLARTIERVEVLAAGPMPRRTRGLKFISDRKGACREFWLVLYEGPRTQAMFACRQVKGGRTFEERQFSGFYTFTAGLTTRLRREVVALARGNGATLRELARLEMIDRAAKQFDADFAREKETVDLAMRRLQLEGQRYRAKNFATDRETGSSQLHSWKARIPGVISRAGGR